MGLVGAGMWGWRSCCGVWQGCGVWREVTEGREGERGSGRKRARVEACPGSARGFCPRAVHR